VDARRGFTVVAIVTVGGNWACLVLFLQNTPSFFLSFFLLVKLWDSGFTRLGEWWDMVFS